MNVPAEFTIVSMEQLSVQIHLALTTAPASLVTVETVKLLHSRRQVFHGFLSAKADLCNQENGNSIILFGRLNQPSWDTNFYRILYIQLQTGVLSCLYTTKTWIRTKQKSDSKGLKLSLTGTGVEEIISRQHICSWYPSKKKLKIRNHRAFDDDFLLSSTKGCTCVSVSA